MWVFNLHFYIFFLSCYMMCVTVSCVNKSVLSLLRWLPLWCYPHLLLSTGAPAPRRLQPTRSYWLRSDSSFKPAGHYCCCWSMGQMDRWTSDHYIDLALHTVWAASIIVCNISWVGIRKPGVSQWHNRLGVRLHTKRSPVWFVVRAWLSNLSGKLYCCVRVTTH